MELVAAVILDIRTGLWVEKYSEGGASTRQLYPRKEDRPQDSCSLGSF